MFCPKCGTRIMEQHAKFCTNCGENLLEVIEEISRNQGKPLRESINTVVQSTPQHTIQSSIPHAPEEPLRQKVKRDKKRAPLKPSTIAAILIPIVLLIITSGISAAFYYKEKQVNEEVLLLQSKGEKLALEEKYDQAIKELKKALELRPNYLILEDDIKAIEAAKELDKKLNEINQKLQSKDIETAAQLMEEFRKELEKRVGILFDRFYQLLEEKETVISVYNVKEEIDEISSIQELGEKLQTVQSVDTDEAKEVVKLIKNKMIEISTIQVEERLKNNDYDTAFDVIEDSMKMIGNHEKLVALKDKVTSAQQAFEKLEQQRVEQELAKQEEQDYYNRTSAVYIDENGWDVYIDDYGDLVIYGTIENTASVPIEEVVIEVLITSSEDGRNIGTHYMNVTPYELQPGDVGYFEDTFAVYYEEVEVQITNITWYLQ